MCMQTHIASDLVFIFVNVQVLSVGCCDGGDDDDERGWCKTHNCAMFVACVYDLINILSRA